MPKTSSRLSCKFSCRSRILGIRVCSFLQELGRMQDQPESSFLSKIICTIIRPVFMTNGKNIVTLELKQLDISLID